MPKTCRWPQMNATADGKPVKETQGTGGLPGLEYIGGGKETSEF
jgi:hypothetical protein